MTRSNRNNAQALDPDNEVDDGLAGPDLRETGLGKQEEPKPEANGAGPAPVQTTIVATAGASELSSPGMQELIEFGLPACPAPHGVYLQRRLDLTLTSRQQKAIRWMFEGLHKNHETMSNGRHVDSVTDVVRYILDRAADSLGIE